MKRHTDDRCTTIHTYIYCMHWWTVYVGLAWTCPNKITCSWFGFLQQPIHWHHVKISHYVYIVSASTRQKRTSPLAVSSNFLAVPIAQKPQAYMQIVMHTSTLYMTGHAPLQAYCTFNCHTHILASAQRLCTNNSIIILYPAWALKHNSQFWPAWALTWASIQKMLLLLEICIWLW